MEKEVPKMSFIKQILHDLNIVRGLIFVPLDNTHLFWQDEGLP